jgi:glycosyltransferase involved in cell wall biosynthesis
VLVSVAIPVRDGGAVLVDALEAVRRQALREGVEVELVVCDSGSRDGSRAAARARGAEVIEIAPREFSHGGTRNLLMQRTGGEVVAFLTQDAVPAGEHWLARLLAGFAAADAVGLVFGPYIPRADASAMVRRELEAWFRSLSPDGSVRVDRLAPSERAAPPRALYGARGYFTDANGAVARAAWERVPFRPVAYAEDHALAHDVLQAGFAKVFAPDAAVIHSHDYGAWEWTRRSFDEARAVRELYELEDLGDVRRLARSARGSVGADLRYAGGLRAAGIGGVELLVRSLGHHGARALGTALGARAERLSPAIVEHLSLEGRR